MRKFSIGILTMAAAMVMMIGAPEQTYAAMNSGSCGQTSVCVSADCKNGCCTLSGDNCGLGCETDFRKGGKNDCGTNCGSGCSSSLGSNCGSFGNGCGSFGSGSSCGQNFIGTLMQNGMNSGMSFNGISMRPGSCSSVIKR